MGYWVFVIQISFFRQTVHVAGSDKEENLTKLNEIVAVELILTVHCVSQSVNQSISRLVSQ